ncbi:MAG: hypothetical protein KJ646_01130 [Nanoarchaeota archaeon]|nr:hypothetical protein [Nanoarchaeota archaeon]MBU4117100.1 hypothetical protein [Nanoarchaeota archaeon]MBU4311053.1 hypothetical protein [bacterium]
MMLQNMFVSTLRVRTFVRDALKCGCPDSVFDDVRIGLPTLYDTHNVAGGLEMLVGKRLLVAVVPFENVGNPDSDIPGILERGRRVRDENGFNRYRLVLVGSHDTKRHAQLEALSLAFDDRIHIHLLEEHELHLDGE